jgi:hypothetical protein
MNSMLIVLLTLMMQTAPSANPASTLVGRWSTTSVPKAGEAPMGPPSFVVEIKGDKTLVTFERRDPIEAVVFAPARPTGFPALIVRREAGPGVTEATVIRAVSAGEATVEVLFERPDGRSFYYVETFKKAK